MAGISNINHAKGVDQALVKAVDAALRELGMSAVATPAGVKSNRAGRPNSNHPSGLAIDIQIMDANGNPLPNGSRKYSQSQNAAAYRVYQTVAEKAYELAPPATQAKMRWGGYFGGGIHPMDTMHFDIRGSATGAGTLGQGLLPAYETAWGIPPKTAPIPKGKPLAPVGDIPIEMAQAGVQLAPAGILTAGGAPKLDPAFDADPIGYTGSPTKAMAVIAAGNDPAEVAAALAADPDTWPDATVDGPDMAKMGDVIDPVAADFRQSSSDAIVNNLRVEPKRFSSGPMGIDPNSFNTMVAQKGAQLPRERPMSSGDRAQYAVENLDMPIQPQQTTPTVPDKDQSRMPVTVDVPLFDMVDQAATDVLEGNVEGADPSVFLQSPETAPPTPPSPLPPSEVPQVAPQQPRSGIERLSPTTVDRRVQQAFDASNQPQLRQAGGASQYKQIGINNLVDQIAASVNRPPTSVGTSGPPIPTARPSVDTAPLPSARPDPTMSAMTSGAFAGPSITQNAGPLPSWTPSVSAGQTSTSAPVPQARPSVGIDPNSYNTMSKPAPVVAAPAAPPTPQPRPAPVDSSVMPPLPVAQIDSLLKSPDTSSVPIDPAADPLNTELAMLARAGGTPNPVSAQPAADATEPLQQIDPLTGLPVNGGDPLSLQAAAGAPQSLPSVQAANTGPKNKFVKAAANSKVAPAAIGLLAGPLAGMATRGVQAIVRNLSDPLQIAREFGAGQVGGSNNYGTGLPTVSPNGLYNPAAYSVALARAQPGLYVDDNIHNYGGGAAGAVAANNAYSALKDQGYF